jgi:glycosyltransferase involved in cell wall biosynthesis
VDKLQIAVAVHGRFHAFDLVRALADLREVEVRLLTNYSPAECETFGISRAAVTSFVAHRWLQRLAYRFLKQPLPRWAESAVHESFGRWASRRLTEKPPEVLRVFSGVAEESLRNPRLSSTLKILTRGSSHIRVQRQLLLEESARAGVRMDVPSDYMLAREEREYSVADAVVVLSSFAKDSFIQSGFNPSRLLCIPNAVNLDWYGASAAVLEARKERLLSGAALRVLTVGSFSYRKGILDIEKISGQCEFRFVGDVPAEGYAVKQRLAGKMEFVDRVPAKELAAQYAWADVFLFPTIEDGFPAVLSQALAAGLPVITTPNGSGPDVVREGTNGWCVAARDVPAMTARLEWLHTHRAEAWDCAKAAAASCTTRSWHTVAEEFVQQVQQRWKK